MFAPPCSHSEDNGLTQDVLVDQHPGASTAVACPAAELPPCACATSPITSMGINKFPSCHSGLFSMGSTGSSSFSNDYTGSDGELGSYKGARELPGLRKAGSAKGGSDERKANTASVCQQKQQQQQQQQQQWQRRHSRSVSEVSGSEASASSAGIWESRIGSSLPSSSKFPLVLVQVRAL